MRWARRILLGGVAVVVAAGVGGYWYERPLLLTGTGYAAHNACAVTRIAGRTDPGRDLPPNLLVPYLRSKAGDPTSGSLLGVLAQQDAWYAEGFGCTLAPDRPDLGEAIAVDDQGNPFTDAPSPAPTPGIRAAIARAFGDGQSADGRQALGTRAVLVVHRGRLIGERYADGFDADTPQLGWSMAKSVTNLIVGRLVHDGAVGLDDDHLRAEWTDRRGDITIDQLLRMTSGLRWDETYDLGTPITRMLYLEPDMGRYVASQPLAHTPGSYQQYSSGSHTLLCAILADRTGLGANLPRRTIFAPLGLSSAVIEPDAAGTPVCSSYLWATPRDWVTIGQFALQEGRWHGRRLLPRAWMAQSTRAVDADTGGPDRTEEEGYGAGWWLNQTGDGSLVHPELPRDAYFAQGHDGQWLIVVPSQQLVVLRMGFTPERDDDGAIRLAADVVEALRSSR